MIHWIARRLRRFFWGVHWVHLSCVLFRPLPAPVVDVVRSAQGLLVDGAGTLARLAFFFLVLVKVAVDLHAWLFAVPLASSFRLLLVKVQEQAAVKAREELLEDFL